MSCQSKACCTTTRICVHSHPHLRPPTPTHTKVFASLQGQPPALLPGMSSCQQACPGTFDCAHCRPSNCVDDSQHGGGRRAGGPNCHHGTRPLALYRLLYPSQAPLWLWLSGELACWMCRRCCGSLVWLGCERGLPGGVGEVANPGGGQGEVEPSGLARARGPGWVLHFMAKDSMLSLCLIVAAPQANQHPHNDEQTLHRRGWVRRSGVGVPDWQSFPRYFLKNSQKKAEMSQVSKSVCLC